MGGTEPHSWVTGRIGDITCRIDGHKANCVRGSHREPDAEVGHSGVEVFENHPEILCKMAASWRCLAVDCGLDRRCHGRPH
jgi:hypothetical protein